MLGGIPICEKKRVFLSSLYIKPFCQDRLGTNIGKVEKKRALFAPGCPQTRIRSRCHARPPFFHRRGHQAGGRNGKRRQAGACPRYSRVARQGKTNTAAFVVVLNFSRTSILSPVQVRGLSWQITRQFTRVNFTRVEKKRSQKRQRASFVLFLSHSVMGPGHDSHRIFRGRPEDVIAEHTLRSNLRALICPP